MPRAPNRFGRDYTLAQRPSVVGAFAADGEDALADARKQHGLLPDVTTDHAAVRQGGHRHTFGKVRAGRLIALCRHVVYSPRPDFLRSPSVRWKSIA